MLLRRSAAMTSGVATLGDIRKVGRTGLYTVAYYVVTTGLAVAALQQLEETDGSLQVALALWCRAYVEKILDRPMMQPSW